MRQMLDSLARVDCSTGPDCTGISPMTEQPWLALNGLQPDAPKYPVRATLAGEGIVVFRTKTGFRGVQRSCPHMQATMMNAELIANETMIRCPLHVFTFKMMDGKGVNCPGFRIKVYEIKEEGGAFYGRCINANQVEAAVARSD
jgi:nitrite reductase/ring-hydroxylating ferredoxin subunit